MSHSPPVYTQADVDRLMEKTRQAATANTLAVCNAAIRAAKQSGLLPPDTPFRFKVEPEKIISIMNRMARDGMRYKALLPLYLSLQNHSPTPEAIEIVESALDIMIATERQNG